jgi:hypothetical protein
MFSKRKFTILVGEDDTHTGCKQEHTFIFHLVDEKACKHLWKCAVEYHAFFRLRTSLRQIMLTSNSGGSANGGSGGGLLNGFIRRGSRFRGPERTEFQTLNMQRNSAPRRSVQFERKPSQRFSKRASYANKRRQNQHGPHQTIDQQKHQVSNNQNIPQIPPPPSHYPQQSSKLKTGFQNQQNLAHPIAASRATNSKIITTASTYSTETTINANGNSKQSVVTVQKCCRLQASSNGAEHDLKCNLYKAQLMQQQQQMNFAQKSSLNNSKMTSNASNSCGGSSNSCASSSSGVVMPSSSSCSSTTSSCEKNICETDSADEINVDTRPTANLRSNLLDKENGLLVSEKLTNKDTNCLLVSKNNTKKPTQSVNNNTSNINSALLNLHNTNSLISNQNQVNIGNQSVNAVVSNGQRLPPQLHPRSSERVNGQTNEPSSTHNGKQTHIITEI